MALSDGIPEMQSIFPLKMRFYSHLAHNPRLRLRNISAKTDPYDGNYTIHVVLIQKPQVPLNFRILVGRFHLKLIGVPFKFSESCDQWALDRAVISRAGDGLQTVHRGRRQQIEMLNVRPEMPRASLSRTFLRRARQQVAFQHHQQTPPARAESHVQHARTLHQENANGCRPVEQRLQLEHTNRSRHGRPGAWKSQRAFGQPPRSRKESSKVRSKLPEQRRENKRGTEDIRPPAEGTSQATL
jgi:hypothetical protein